MIDYADKDRDGRISFEEFVEIITKEYPQVWDWASFYIWSIKKISLEKSRKCVKWVYDINSFYILDTYLFEILWV